MNKLTPVILSFLLSSSCMAACPVLDVTGTPTTPANSLTLPVCHTAYAALVDVQNLVPRWVAYDLTGAHTLGCFKRQNNFHADEMLPENHRASPGDYAHSGYDIGHQIPAGDAEWDADAMSSTFSLANMAPQLPGLNREQWENLEVAVRVWATTHNDLHVFVGPIVTQSTKTIGHGVRVPDAFYKVIYDPVTKETISFQMPQENIPKGDLAPYLKPVQDIERETGIVFPVTQVSSTVVWPYDVKLWNQKHQAACTH